MCLGRSEAGHIPVLELQVCELPVVGARANSDPLQEQHSLLATRPSFSPSKCRVSSCLCLPSARAEGGHCHTPYSSIFLDCLFMQPQLALNCRFSCSSSQLSYSSFGVCLLPVSKANIGQPGIEHARQVLFR